MNDFILVIPQKWNTLRKITLPPGKTFTNIPLRDEAVLIFYENRSNKNDPRVTKNLITNIGNDNVFFKSEKMTLSDVLNLIKYSIDFCYVIYYDPENKQVNVYTSIFNILPLYYYSSKDLIVVSSKATLIANSLPIFPTINKKFILELTLFNYTFQNETIFENIRTVPANCYLEVKSTKGLAIVKHTKIEDYFVSSPIPWKKSIDTMSDLFLERVQNYFPDEKFYISFTDGFDGRTLVAGAKKFNKNFKTFAFGANDNEDITIPLRNSRELGLDFVPVYLNDVYTKNHFVQDGKELLSLTDGSSSFLHVHYLYSAKYLSQWTNYIINGMFGSELFRALHIRGQITSQALVDFFFYESERQWVKKLKDSSFLNYLRIENFKEELDNLISDLILYKQLYSKDLNKNQLFYKYIFEEAFRKTFGNFIVMQLPYVKIRSPYLDFIFIKNLLKTGLAGVNNDFFTHNPIKRFKGQVLYAHIIKKSYTQLYYQFTGKGYRPKDLISPFGSLHLAYAYFYKRIQRKFTQENMDNLGIISGIQQNRAFFDSVDLIDFLFNKKNINKLFSSAIWTTYSSSLRDILIQLLSMNYFINQISN
jgi:hypothetical protein